MTTNLNIQQPKITSGTSLSSEIDLGNSPPTALVALEMPTGWDAASVTFQVSTDGTNFFNFYDDAGVEVAMTVAASRVIRMIPSLFAGIRKLKIRSGTSGAPVNQTADRVFKAVSREV